MGITAFKKDASYVCDILRAPDDYSLRTYYIRIPHPSQRQPAKLASLGFGESGCVLASAPAISIQLTQSPQSTLWKRPFSFIYAGLGFSAQPSPQNQQILFISENTAVPQAA